MADTTDEIYMRRCFQLAELGRTHVKTNPLVGCVIVHNDKIIGEGYHEKYGEAHAERKAVADIPRGKIHLLSDSTLYVSLEPCNHTGKTPPCTDLILDSKIPKVVVANTDPNPLMRGKSIERLMAGGIQVNWGILEEGGRSLNRNYFVNQNRKMPYIILKWAESRHGFMGLKDSQIKLSNNQTDVLVHKWRSESDGILVGTNTVLIDNPLLTNRLFPGPSPQRIIIDRKERLPKSCQLLSDGSSTWIYTHNAFYQLDQPHKKCNVIVEDIYGDPSLIFKDLYEKGIGDILIEGGRIFLESLISKNLWDEARIIKTDHSLKEGVKSPLLSGKKEKEYRIVDDKILIIKNLHNISAE